METRHWFDYYGLHNESAVHVVLQNLKVLTHSSNELRVFFPQRFDKFFQASFRQARQIEAFPCLGPLHIAKIMHAGPRSYKSCRYIHVDVVIIIILNMLS